MVETLAEQEKAYLIKWVEERWKRTAPIWCHDFVNKMSREAQMLFMREKENETLINNKADADVVLELELNLLCDECDSWIATAPDVIDYYSFIYDRAGIPRSKFECQFTVKP